MKKDKEENLSIRLIIIPIIIVIDQLSKFLIMKFVKDEINLLIFKIKTVGNTGFAFGLNSGANIMNVLISLLFISVIIRFLITQKENITPKTEIILYLILGGGISNIIDRVIRNAVVDFISIGDFPIFNIADICIVIGWVLFVWTIVIYAVQRDEKRLRKIKRMEKKK